MNFFGLSDEYLEAVYSSLHGILRYNNGYDFLTLYNMPVQLRKWLIEKIEKEMKKEMEEYEKAKK